MVAVGSCICDYADAHGRPGFFPPSDDSQQVVKVVRDSPRVVEDAEPLRKLGWHFIEKTGAWVLH